MAKKYIDAEAALTAVKVYCPAKYETEMLARIVSIPSADVVEVKRGRWVTDRLVSTSGGTYGVRRCNLCEAYYQDIGYGYNYCPNCGAKMEAEDDTR